MNITKKLCSLFLALCVCISLSVSVHAVDSEGAPANEEPSETAESVDNILIAANFPDENFLLALQDSYPDGLTAEAAIEVTSLVIIDKGISDLTGIELFPALEYLYADRNQLTEMDISNNPMLVYVSCGVNQLSALDVIKNPALEELFCQNNQITDLDLSGNPYLRNLVCFGNELKILDLSQNAELESLSCRGNHLATLDLSANPCLAPDTQKLLSVTPQMIDIGEVGETFDLIEYAPDVDGGKIFNVENATVEGTVFSGYENGCVIYYFYEVDYVSGNSLFCVEVRFSKTEVSKETEPEPSENDGDSPAPGVSQIPDEETTDPADNSPPPEETTTNPPSENPPSENPPSENPPSENPPPNSSSEDTAPGTSSEPDNTPVSDGPNDGNENMPPASGNDHSASYEPSDRSDYPTTNPAPVRKDGTPAESTENEPVTMPFSDVPESSYYYDAVLWAVRQGITVGTSETTFSPNESCSRAQLVTFLWRAAGFPEPKYTTIQFDDVPENAYYSKAVLWAREIGITTGTGSNMFSPDLIMRIKG